MKLIEPVILLLNEGYYWLFFATGALLLVIFLIRKIKHRRWINKENLPREIWSASLWGSEKSIHCTRPIKLHGKVDQVYQKKDGTLIVTDAKFRAIDRIYKSDIVQLSVYRVILRNSGFMARLFPRKVAKYGYIRLQVSNKISYKRVKLLTEKDIVLLADSYYRVTNGIVAPTRSTVKSLCRKCPYHENC